MPKKILILINLLILLCSALAFQNRQVTRIWARLYPREHLIRAKMQIRYMNQSPDTLQDLYFFLYYNQTPKAGIFIDSVQCSQQKITLHNFDALARVHLSEGLPPGDSIMLNIDYHALVPLIGDRWGYMGEQFILGAWYPQIAVYDERGWHLMTSRDGEFYQEFGDFVVDFEVPSRFQLLSTGDAVLRDTLTIENDNGKTEKYHSYHIKARSVQDFLVAVDPEYEIHKIQFGRIPIQVAYPDYLSDLWEGMDSLGYKTLAWLEKQIGTFPYSSLDIISGYVAAGGIEYPEAVVINAGIGDKAELQKTIIHEIIHQYFFGGLGNNQTEYGWMDEGFATFLEEEISRDFHIQSHYDWEWPPRIFWSTVRIPRFEEYSDYWYASYLHEAGFDAPSDWVLDWYTGDGYFFHYEKIALVLTQLKNYLGDSLFYAVLKKYYGKFYKKHPYPEDFYKIVDQVTDEPLSIFLKEAISTSLPFDVGVEQVYMESHNDSVYRYSIKLKRYTPITMPIVLKVKRENTIETWRIPLSVRPRRSKHFLNPWLPYQEKYKATITTYAPVQDVWIEKKSNLLDFNWANDHWKGRHFPLVLVSPRVYDQYEFPGIFVSTVKPKIFFDNYSKVTPGLRWNIRKNHNWEMKNELEMATGPKSFYYKTEISYRKNFQNRQQIQIKAFHNNRFLFSESGLEMGFVLQQKNKNNLIRLILENFQVQHTNPSNIFWKEKGINTISFFAERGNKNRYSFFNNFDHWSLEWHLAPVRHSVTSFSLSFLHKREWNYAAEISIGGQVVLQQKNQLPFLKYSDGGILWKKYISHPYHGYSGIIPASWFRRGHQGLSNAAGYIDLPGEKQYQLGGWFHFHVSPFQVNDFLESKIFRNMMIPKMYFWEQNRILEQSIKTISMVHMRFDFGVTLSVQSRSLRKWLPEIKFHAPLFSYDSAGWHSTRSYWLIEISYGGRI